MYWSCDLRRAKKGVKETEEPWHVLDMKQRRLQELVEFGIEVRTVPIGGRVGILTMDKERTLTVNRISSYSRGA